MPEYRQPYEYLQNWTPGKQQAFPVSGDFANSTDYMQAVKNWQQSAAKAKSSPSWSSGLKSSGGGGASNVAKAPFKRTKPRGLPGLPGPLQRQYLNSLAKIRQQSSMGRIGEEQTLRDALLRTSQMTQQAGRAAAGGLSDLMSGGAEAGVGTSPAISQMAIDQAAAQEAGARMAADAARVQALQQMTQSAFSRGLGTTQQLTDLEDWKAQQRAALVNQQLAELLKGAK